MVLKHFVQLQPSIEQKGLCYLTFLPWKNCIHLIGLGINKEENLDIYFKDAEIVLFVCHRVKQMKTTTNVEVCTLNSVEGILQSTQAIYYSLNGNFVVFRLLFKVYLMLCFVEEMAFLSRRWW